MKTAAAIALACFAVSALAMSALAMSALAMSAPAAAQGANEASADARRLVECVNGKAGASSPGAAQSCVGLVYEACMTSSGDTRVCNRREAVAWMETLKRSAQERKRLAGRNMEVYDNAVRRIRGQARALCHAAAAVSPWGSEAVAKGTFERSDTDMTGCERDAIARQALVILVTSRGD